MNALAACTVPDRRPRTTPAGPPHRGKPSAPTSYGRPRPYTSMRAYILHLARSHRLQLERACCSLELPGSGAALTAGARRTLRLLTTAAAACLPRRKTRWPSARSRSSPPPAPSHPAWPRSGATPPCALAAVNLLPPESPTYPTPAPLDRRRHDLVRAWADEAESRMQELSVEQLTALYSLLGEPAARHCARCRESLLQLTADRCRRSARR